MIGRLMCWLGRHEPLRRVIPRFNVAYYCVRCRAVVRGGLR